MALSFVGAADYAAASGALPTFVAGDLAIVFAYRDGNNTAPSLPAGWTNIGSSGASSNSARGGWRVLLSGDTSTGTWTNATEVQVIILRGQLTAADPKGGHFFEAQSSNQIAYGTFAFVPSGFSQGSSWVVGFAGHRTATDVNTKAATAMTTRSGDVTSLGLHTAENVASFADTNYTTTVNASAAWYSLAVEVRAAAGSSQTGVAQIHLEGANFPETQTEHVLTVRARVTVANGEVLKAQLYEGATARTSELTTTALTNVLTDYALAIDDSEADTITSYANLNVYLWGYSSVGNPAVFEIAEVALAIPSAALGAESGRVDMPLALGAITSGSVTPAGTTSTGVAQISLAGGLVPETRTDHSIVVRARKTNGAHTGTIRALLYEGASPRSAVLESSALSTSLADYALDIADADAATIGSYANLELRLWGYSSTATATVFEIAKAYLALPNSGTGGDVLGAAVLSSSVSITVSAVPGVYPNTNVYPYPLITLASTATATVGSTHIGYGAIVLPLTLGTITDGSSPINDRQGRALLATTVTIAAVGNIPDRYGAAVLASTVEIRATGSGQVVSDAALLASTVTITVAGVVPTIPAPPGFTTVFDDMPSLLIAIAFVSEPFSPLQYYDGVTEYARGVSANGSGRQFELDRMEAGSASFVLSNNDSRFSPENTSSPYYPNVKPTHRFRWQAFWDGQTYDLFHGFLEGYPQEFPQAGNDALVRQRATDFTMALALAKLVPGSTILTSDLPAVGNESVSTTLDVAGTALPMPQTAPFEIEIDGEAITVTAINSGTQYAVTRQAGSLAHTAGLAVTTTAVSFGQELTGQRIRNVLARIGVSPGDYAVDDGQTLLTASDDIAGQSPIEHLTLVAEVEGGRLFVAGNGKVTFHERHRPLKTELTARATFGDAGGAELPYSGIEVTHEHERIYNVVRVTTTDGYVVEARDQDSIDAHFERVLEKSWPMANHNDADAAVRYLLARYSTMQLRVPSIVLQGRGSPDLMWPQLLGMEIGQRFRVIRRVPGTDIDKQLLVEGVEYSQTPSNLAAKVQLSLAATTAYWRLGVAGFTELGTTTRIAY